MIDDTTATVFEESVKRAREVEITDKQLYFPLEDALSYADDSLVATSNKDLSPEDQLEWLRVHDLHTRTTMMELMELIVYPGSQ